MFNTKLKKLSALMLLGASVSLSGCDLFDNDDDSSSSFAAFEGNALKGALINAEVGLYFHTDIGTPLYTTSTDENGDYSFNAVLEQTGIYVVKVTADDDTTMICDTDNCGTDENPIAFGEVVPSASLVGIELTNVTFVEETEELLTIETQINAITSLATELLILNLESSNPDLAVVTAGGFTNMQVAVTQTVAATFGIDVGADQNVFDLQLPNLNDASETSQAGTAESGFSLLNAAVTTAASDNIAESISLMLETATVLADTPSSEDGHEEAANAWIDLHNIILDDAVMISMNENITLSEDAGEAVTELEKAANEGIDLTVIEEAHDEANDVVEEGGETGGSTGGNGG